MNLENGAVASYTYFKTQILCLGVGESPLLWPCAFIEKVVPFLKSFYKVFLCCKGRDEKYTEVTHCLSTNGLTVSLIKLYSKFR